jgi:predicted nucleotidyltransferase
MDEQLTGIIRSILQGLQGKIEPQRLVLFGSRVSGNADAWSDLDLLIIAPSQDRPVERRLKVRRLLRELDERLGLDIFFYTPEEAASLTDEPSSFLRQILNTGVTIYDRENR